MDIKCERTINTHIYQGLVFLDNNYLLYIFLSEISWTGNLKLFQLAKPYLIELMNLYLGQFSISNIPNPDQSKSIKGNISRNSSFRYLIENQD